MSRERNIDADASAILAMLKRYESNERDFVLEEIIRVCRARRSRSKSSQYHLDFSTDEPPTDPEVDLGTKETTRVNIREIRALIKKKDDDR